VSSFKLTIGSTVFENDQAITIKNIRPENNISTLEFVINDYKSKAYSDVVAKLSQVTLELKNKKSSYTTTFTGEVYALQPSSSPEILTVFCKGLEHCLELTHCDTSLGTESQNPTVNTPREIIQELVNEYTQKHFGGTVTWWGLDAGNSYVEDVHSGLSVTNLTSKYHSNLTMLNRLSEIVNAYAQTLGTPEPGIHWFVLPNSTTPRLYVKEIGDNHSDGTWPKYYGSSQSAATVTQGEDLLNYNFHQSLNSYANNVVLACALRKPAYDYWTEDADTNGVWTIRDGDISLSDDATNKVVGADSLKLTIDASQIDAIYYEPTNTWNLSYIGSQDSIPTIDFYARRTSNANSAVGLRLYTTLDVDHYTIVVYNTASDVVWMPEANLWYGISIPIGPHYKNFGGMPAKQWGTLGAEDWTNITGIEFLFNNTGFAGENYFWIDDLHLSGKIVRDARDASEISINNPERQIFLRLDTAIDDSCNTTDNTGTAARLAASELFKRGQFKTTDANRGLTGTITLPMKEDLLPGQQLYVNAGKKADGAYRYQLDMRIKQLTHTVSNQGYLTQCNLTSDLWNSHTFDTPSAWGILQTSAGALGHAEARDLKASGLDINIPRLAWDPTV